jgi:hypothetical protein
LQFKKDEPNRSSSVLKEKIIKYNSSTGVGLSPTADAKWPFFEWVQTAAH